MNPLFNALGGMMSGNAGVMGLINQFKSNPMAMLRQRFNIPDNINDPNAVIQHLMLQGSFHRRSMRKQDRWHSSLELNN